MQDDLSKMSGEGAFRTSFSVDEVTLDGDLGRFSLRPKDGKKDEVTGKWPRVELDAGVKLQFDPDTGKKNIIETKPLKVVMLKIRRRMAYFEPGFYMNTQEHNSKNDFVLVYGHADKISGIASDAWKRVKDLGYTLKTRQILYCYSPEMKKVIRVIAKGASLSTQKEKPKVPGVTKFYDYLKSFTGDEHFYNFITELTPVAEEGPKGLYFALNFVRGERLTPEQQERVNTLLKETHEAITAVDDAFAEKTRMIRSGLDSQIQNAMPDSEQEQSGYDYPQEEINSEDIPF